ncbi:hypothetical protein IEQ34_017476 [Dendrobium chrysotoxum]|uniref:Uncharacterized protein n=1 Tax=Dendrobium chrysotoxum TaxID=161865 RepID=A0AAV7GC31_DENCH|nr:hypothetical protein IEQ34_017476 [Dendrobium chrysotoxum]
MFVSNTQIPNLNSPTDTTLVDSLPTKAELVITNLIVPEEVTAHVLRPLSSKLFNQNKFSILQVNEENVIPDTSQNSSSFQDSMTKVLDNSDVLNQNALKQYIATGKVPRRKMARKANASNLK